MSTPPSACERCAGTGRVDRGTGYALDEQHDVCTSCFHDDALGIDDEDLGRAMARAKQRRHSVRRLLECLLLESTSIGSASAEFMVDRVMQEREDLRLLLVEADRTCSSAAVDDAVELAMPMAYRGRLQSGREIGEFILELAARLHGDAEYIGESPRPATPRRSAT